MKIKGRECKAKPLSEFQVIYTFSIFHANFHFGDYCFPYFINEELSLEALNICSKSMTSEGRS